MVNQWFKFYGGEYLSDPKMLALSAAERSCFLTLLCYASLSGKEGEVKHLTEDMLMAQSGVLPQTDEWARTCGILKKLEKLNIVTLDNECIVINHWRSRQEKALTPYERLKRHRDKQKNDNGDNADDNAREEENREEKNRIEKSIKYLVSIPVEDLRYFTERFIAREDEVRSKAEDLKLYCERKGRVYKDYRAFLLNALKRDFKERGKTKQGKYSHT